MTKSEYYICEYCKQSFVDKEECELHEHSHVFPSRIVRSAFRQNKDNRYIGLGQERNGIYFQLLYMYPETITIEMTDGKKISYHLVMESEKT